MDSYAKNIEELSIDDLVALLERATDPAVPIDTFYRVLDQVVRTEQALEIGQAAHQAAPRPEKEAQATPGP